MSLNSDLAKYQKGGGVKRIEEWDSGRARVMREKKLKDLGQKKYVLAGVKI